MAEWLGTWANRIEIEVDYTNKIGASVMWFPVDIIIESGLAGVGNEDISAIFDELTADANRFKIAVTKSDGTTQLYVEIELWDDANEDAVLHVSRDGWTIDDDMSIYIYYDVAQDNNTTYVADQGSRTEVYDATHKMVQHMNSASDAQLVDSTSNNNDSTANTLDTTAGVIGLAMNNDGSEFGSIADFASVGDSGESLTVSAWVNGAAQEEKSIVSHYDTNQLAWNMFSGPAGNTDKLYVSIIEELDDAAGDKLYYSSITAFNSSEHHIAIRWDAGTLDLFVDGVKDGSVTKTTDDAFTTMEDPTCAVLIGADTPSVPANFFTGDTDEVRVCDSVRSDAWIKAEYNSGNDSLLTYGAEVNLLGVKIYPALKNLFDERMGKILKTSLNENLAGVTNGTFADLTGWTESTSYPGGALTHDAAGLRAHFTKGAGSFWAVWGISPAWKVPVVTGKNYSISFTVSDSTEANVRVKITDTLESGATTYYDIGLHNNGVFQYEWVANVTGNISIYFTNDNLADELDYYIDNIFISKLEATVTDGSVFTESLPYHIILRDLTYGNTDEICKVTARDGNDLTIARGQCGTTAIGHWYGDVYLCDTDTSVAESLTADALTITVYNAATTLPPDGSCDYFLLLRDWLYTGFADEIVRVTGVSGNVLTVVRGEAGTAPTAYWYPHVYLCDADTWLLEWYDDSETKYVDDGGGFKPVYGAGAGALCLPDDVSDTQIRYSVKGVAITGEPFASPLRGALAYRAWDDITNETDEANEDTANDMTLLTATPATGHAYFFGGLHQFTSFIIDIGTAGVKGSTNYTIAWEYYKSAEWVDLSVAHNLVDGTLEFEAAAGLRTVSFDLPSDWIKLTVDGLSAYWIRAYVTAVDNQAGYTQPLGTQAWIETEIFSGFSSEVVEGGHEYAATILGWKNSSATLPETIPEVICFDIQRAAIAAATVDARVLIWNTSGETRKIHVEIKNGVGLTVTPDDGAPNYTSFAIGQSQWVDGEFTMPAATQEWEYIVKFYSDEISDWIETHAVDPALDMATEEAVTEEIAVKPKLYITYMVYHYDDFLTLGGDDYIDACITEVNTLLGVITMFDVQSTTVKSDYDAPHWHYFYPDAIDTDEVPAAHLVVELHMEGEGVETGNHGGNEIAWCVTPPGETQWYDLEPCYFDFYSMWIMVPYNTAGGPNNFDTYTYALTQLVIHELFHGVYMWLGDESAKLVGYPIHHFCGYEETGSTHCISHPTILAHSTHKDGYYVVYHQISADGYDNWPILFREGTASGSGVGEGTATGTVEHYIIVEGEAAGSGVGTGYAQIIEPTYPDTGGINYKLELRDSDGDLIAVLNNAYNISYTQAINSPYELTFSIPADDSKTEYITLANEIWLINYRTGEVVKKFKLKRTTDVREVWL